MHIFTALAKVLLYFSSENRLKSVNEMPSKAKAIYGSLTFNCGFARVTAYFSPTKKGKCFELGELGITRESLKCRICVD